MYLIFSSVSSTSTASPTSTASNVFAAQQARVKKISLVCYWLGLWNEGGKKTSEQESCTDILAVDNDIIDATGVNKSDYHGIKPDEHRNSS